MGRVGASGVKPHVAMYTADCNLEVRSRFNQLLFHYAQLGV